MQKITNEVFYILLLHLVFEIHRFPPIEHLSLDWPEVKYAGATWPVALIQTMLVPQLLLSVMTLALLYHIQDKKPHPSRDGTQNDGDYIG